MDKPQRKMIRLSPTIYEIPEQYFSITIGTYHRQPYFNHKPLAKNIFETLKSDPLQTETHLSAICLMPDHLHLLISPNSTSLINVLNRWKSYTTTLARKKLEISKLWQRSFYDHALRKDENINTVAIYILNNPVRANLCNHWSDYPYSWCEWDL